MNLEFSVDKLYETGWQADVGDAALERLPDGRAYPTVKRVQEIFAGCGFDLAIRYVQLFDCYRAVWTDRTGAAAGAVVGSDDREAAVYALAEMRRSMATAAAGKP
jgi:hypothetical protein